MATAEEILAAAERAKAAGNTAAEKALRAKAAEIAPAPDAIRAAADRAKAAGNEAAYNVLMAKVPQDEPGPQAPAETYEDWSQYPVDANPKTDVLVGQDEFGDNIWRTVSGTKYARRKTTVVPKTKSLSDVSAADVGESLGNLATGIGRSIVQGVTAPGRAMNGEPVTMQDAFATASLAIPDAPASAKLGRAKVATPVETQTARDVAAAQGLGIPVYRTDVKPPSSALGKIVQRGGENVPFVGTGGMRAGQQAARVKAAQEFVRKYGADIPDSALPGVTDDLVKTRSAALTKYAGEKGEVISSVAGKGSVPTPRAAAAIDVQIAKLRRVGGELTGPVIAELEKFKSAISGKAIDALDDVRAIIGDAFTDPNLAKVKSVGEKALNAVYGPLREDMGAFIRAVDGDDAFLKWKNANARLSEMAGDLKITGLKNVLKNADATPEQVGNLLFSSKPSDVARLYRGLGPEGQARARTAIIQKALGGESLDALSPEKFKAALNRLGPQARIFFRGQDFEAIDGLRRALELTQQAGKAVAAPLTGVQNLPAIIAGLAGALTGSVSGAAASIGAAGLAARAWESTGVQRALRIMARAQTPNAQASAAKLLSAALKDAGITLGQTAANAAANNDRIRATGN